jgi:hypothetical protein
MFFPTCTLITTTWLSTFIVIVFSSKCVATIVATLGSNICLVVILSFFGFSFYHIYFLRSGAIFTNWPIFKV